MQERHVTIAENGPCDVGASRFLAGSSLASSLKVEAHFGPLKPLRAFACGALGARRRHEKRQRRCGFGAQRVVSGARLSPFGVQRCAIGGLESSRGVPSRRATATHETLASCPRAGSARARATSRNSSHALPCRDSAFVPADAASTRALPAAYFPRVVQQPWASRAPQSRSRDQRSGNPGSGRARRRAPDGSRSRNTLSEIGPLRTVGPDVWLRWLPVAVLVPGAGAGAPPSSQRGGPARRARISQL